MNRYSKGAIVLHWGMAVLIIGNLAGGFLHDNFPRGSDARTLIMGLHVSLGLTLILLTGLRIGWRLANPPPPLPAYFTIGERVLATASHLGFYAVMLALPLAGWAMADRNDRPLHYFFVIDVPKWGLSRVAAQDAHALHEGLGKLMVALLALHILAIIKHLVMDRDNLLPRIGIGGGRG